MNASSSLPPSPKDTANKKEEDSIGVLLFI
jgi:hypothetical protein